MADDLKNQGGQGGTGDGGDSGAGSGTGKEGQGGAGGAGTGTGGEGGQGGAGEQPFFGTYKTREDAEKGFTEKDSTITKLNEEMAKLKSQADEGSAYRETLTRLVETLGEKTGGQKLTKEQLQELAMEDPVAFHEYMRKDDPELHKTKAEIEKIRQEIREEKAAKVIEALKSRPQFEYLKPGMEELMAQHPEFAGKDVSQLGPVADLFFYASYGKAAEKIAAKSKDIKDAVKLKEELAKLAIMTAGTETGGPGPGGEADEHKAAVDAADRYRTSSF